MKYLFIIMLFLSSVAYTQSIEGRIMGFNSRQVIANASVYISSTSIGTVSNDSGYFKLNNLPRGFLILVVSCIGYENYSYSFEANTATPVFINIELVTAIKDLGAVSVGTYDKDGFRKWGQFFMDNFIGRMNESTDCVIKNPEVLRFKYNNPDKTLFVRAFEPLIIENKHLGYLIKYDLEGFQYNYSSGILQYYGYQFFTEMETKRKGKQKRWNNNRLEAYRGSILHFMRALYHNRLSEEGFEVRRIVKQPNNEKIRVRNLWKSRLSNGSTFTITIDDPPNSDDSSAYYNRIMNQPNEISFLINKPLNADSICTKMDDETKLLSFENYLQVVYKNKKETIEFLQQSIRSANRQPTSISSQITLLGEKKIKVFEKGNYFNPTELLSLDWWSWSEKIATLLPIDFELK